jgi:hypothetical protein
VLFLSFHLTSNIRWSLSLVADFRDLHLWFLSTNIFNTGAHPTNNLAHDAPSDHLHKRGTNLSTLVHPIQKIKIQTSKMAHQGVMSQKVHTYMVRYKARASSLMPVPHHFQPSRPNPPLIIPQCNNTEKLLSNTHLDYCIATNQANPSPNTTISLRRVG